MVFLVKNRVKPQLSREFILDFLSNNFDTDVNSLELLSTGETSQAYIIHSNSGDIVLRVCPNCDGFLKDKYSYEHFHSEDLPIPKVVLLGNIHSSMFFSTTEKAMGKSIIDFDDFEARKFIPELIRTFNAIHEIDVGNTAMYGNWDCYAIAAYASWKLYLQRLIYDFSPHANSTRQGALLEHGVVRKVLAKYI